MAITIKRLSQPPQVSWAISCTEVPELVIHEQIDEDDFRAVSEDINYLREYVAGVLHRAVAKLEEFKRQIEEL